MTKKTLLDEELQATPPTSQSGNPSPPPSMMLSGYLLSQSLNPTYCQKGFSNWQQILRHHLVSQLS